MPRKVLIITGANTAREICGEWLQDLNQWEKARLSLKEYRIVPNPEECKAFEAIEEKVGGKITHLNYSTKLPVGTKVECETNEELLTFYIL